MLTDDLLELQRIDTESDQLAHRAAHLPERETATAAREAARSWERRRSELTTRRAELEEQIAEDERAGEALTGHRARLERQLRTVAAPREVEALMHEIETIGIRRDELDDRELEHLEEQASTETELDALATAEPEVRQAAEDAERVLAGVIAELDNRRAVLDDERAVVVQRLDAPMITRYSRLRDQHRGVAVARLVGSRCDGCHLDLSTAELDDVRRTAPDELAECPYCGRLLVA